MNVNRWGIFDGGRLDRTLPKLARKDPKSFGKSVLEDGALILPVRENAVLTEKGKIKWLTSGELAKRSIELDQEKLIYLGSNEITFFVLQMDEANLEHGLEFTELRKYIRAHPNVPSVYAREISIAGYSLAMSNWAKNIQFCTRCGSAVKSVDLGTRKKCTNCGFKSYPRLDPVAIVMVESPDGQHCLLASPQYGSGKMMTCIAGFIEQCETIEEAVQREVYEECGVEIDEIEILGSQPWPLGRSGACELMIGCIGRAKELGDIRLDERELKNAQWVHRSVVAQKLSTSKEGNLRRDDMGSESWIVPPYAIAHHLIEAWIRCHTGWFSKL